MSSDDNLKSWATWWQFVFENGGPSPHTTTAALRAAIAERWEALENRARELSKALQGVKRGSCWCEMGIGNPMMKDHSPQCVAAKAAILRAVELLEG